MMSSILTLALITILISQQSTALPECVHPLNADEPNGGKCGPSWGGVRCNKNLRSYAEYCNSANGECGNTAAHQNAQPSEDKYDFEPASCDHTMDDCPVLNIDDTIGGDGGRCGPSYGRCNQHLRSYALYCNSATTWCGTTDGHRDAQTDEDKYDFVPATCKYEECPPLNTDSTNGGRCGPNWGDVRCNQALRSDALYCNSDNGWCGDTEAHQNEQPNEDKYDFEPITCVY